MQLLLDEPVVELLVPFGGADVVPEGGRRVRLDHGLLRDQVWDQVAHEVQLGHRLLQGGELGDRSRGQGEDADPGVDRQLRFLVPTLISARGWQWWLKIFIREVIELCPCVEPRRLLQLCPYHRIEEYWNLRSNLTTPHGQSLALLLQPFHQPNKLSC